MSDYTVTLSFDERTNSYYGEGERIFGDEIEVAVHPSRIRIINPQPITIFEDITEIESFLDGLGYRFDGDGCIQTKSWEVWYSPQSGLSLTLWNETNGMVCKYTGHVKFPSKFENKYGIPNEN